MPLPIFASLLITYAVVQTIVLLLAVRFVDPYEREPGSIVALMALWGAVGATTLSAAGNVSFRELLPDDIREVFGAAVYAPVVEEVAKGVALVLFVLVSSRARGRFGIPNFEGVTDGIVYGAAIGLGFAFTEDILYLLLRAAEGGLEEGFVTYLSRRDFFGVGLLHHAIYTSAFGVGLGLATWHRARIARVVLPVGGLLTAMALHALNNGAVQALLVLRHGLEKTHQYLVLGSNIPGGAAMQATARSAVSFVRAFDYVLLGAFVLAVYLWIRYQRRVISEELEEEAAAGLISRTEWRLMPMYWKRSLWYLQLVRTGQWERWRLLKRIHNELVDLALLKRRVRRGRGDPASVHRARLLIEKLKAQKIVFL
jgi:RsiW-degrading membrane proteinase PrsW (M82 family)